MCLSCFRGIKSLLTFYINNFVYTLLAYSCPDCHLKSDHCQSSFELWPKEHMTHECEALTSHQGSNRERVCCKQFYIVRKTFCLIFVVSTNYKKSNRWTSGQLHIHHIPNAHSFIIPQRSYYSHKIVTQRLYRLLPHKISLSITQCLFFHHCFIDHAKYETGPCLDPHTCLKEGFWGILKSLSQPYFPSQYYRCS